MTRETIDYPPALRWWFEEWKPKHHRECDCKGCNIPLMHCLKMHFKAIASYTDADREKYRRCAEPVDGVTMDWFDGLASRNHAHKTLKALERHGLIHPCYARKKYPGRLQNVYKLGSYKECASSEYH